MPAAPNPDTTPSAAIPARRIRVLVNPNAGEKAGVQTDSTPLETVVSVLQSLGLAEEVIETESEEDGRRLAREAVDAGYDMVVAAGGDGTVGSIARELLNSSTALGILPLGSVMNIARMLDIPRELDTAAQIIADGNVRAIDVGSANGNVFFESGSVGLNAAVFREVQRFDSGEYRSILSAIWVAIRYRPARMIIHLDNGAVRTRALMVTIANGPYTGIGFTIAPDAELADGRFDVSLFRRFSRTGLLVHLARVAFGRKHYSPRIETFRSARVHIETHSPLPARADAMDLGTTPVAYEILPGVLRVVAPHS